MSPPGIQDSWAYLTLHLPLPLSHSFFVNFFRQIVLSSLPALAATSASFHFFTIATRRGGPSQNRRALLPDLPKRIDTTTFTLQLSKLRHLNVATVCKRTLKTTQTHSRHPTPFTAYAAQKQHINTELMQMTIDNS